MIKKILHISLPQRLAGQIEGFPLDPSVPLPVEVNSEDWDLSRLEWPALISGMLEVLKRDRDGENADYYRRLIKTVRPDIVQTLITAGELKTDRGDYSFAEDIFLTLCALEPENSLHENNLALFRRRKEETQLLGNGLYKRAFDLIRENKPEEGLPLIKSFLDSRPDSYNGWFLLGWALRLADDWDEAYEAFRKALDLSGPTGELLNELALCESRRGNDEGAASYLRQGLELDGENTTLLSNLALVYLRLNDQIRAEEVLTLLSEIDPEDPLAQQL